MKRQSAYIIINGKHLSADIKDGEVMGWQPITIPELNKDVTKCISYLENIREAMAETKGA